MNDPIRWGVLGASKFALQQLTPALHAARGSRVTVLGTSNAAKAAPFGEFLPDLRIASDYQSVIDADDVDAVYIPLPNHLHVEWTIRALEAGKHVLCEKPIAMRVSDFDHLIAARDTADRLAAEAFMIVHHPQWIRVRELLAAERIGRIRHVEVVFSYRNVDPANIRNQPNMGGGGLRDIGVYAFGAVRYATGQEPTELSASLDMIDDYDTFAEVNSTFPGFSYHGIVSTRLAPRQRVVFHGEGGTIELTAPFNAGLFDQAELIIEDGAAGRTVERWPGVRQYVLQAENFVETVRNGSTYPWTLEQARGSQAMIDEAFRAAGHPQP